MRHFVSRSSAVRACRFVSSGLKDASRQRRRRSPSAILDPGRVAPAFEAVAVMRERLVQSNQGTRFGSGATGGGELGGTVSLAVLRGAPEFADPGASDDAHGMTMLAAAIPGAAVESWGPLGCLARVVGKAGESDAHVSDADPSEYDGADLAEGEFAAWWCRARCGPALVLGANPQSDEGVAPASSRLGDALCR